MASVNKDKKGWRVEFTPPGGKRRQLRLGKISDKGAREIGRHVERIVESKKTGIALPADTEAWLVRMPHTLRTRLVNAGLVASVGHRTSSTFGGFLDEYINSRSDIKAGTRDHFNSARRWLEKFFGADRDMASVTSGEADAYRIWLGTSGQSENTARRLCSRAKQFFRAALRRQLITENPFGDMKKLVVGPSPERRVRFIDRATAQRVLAACPDDEWRVIFALARFGGLRCPSEITPLKWSDISWEAGKITVTCVKTEHHDGRALRVIPLFEEMRQYLLAWRSKAPVEVPWVIGRVRSNKTNLRTQLVRIIEDAELKAWPKLFQNLRSTRETELMEDFPAHVVCAWMGNTPKVAAKHYLQVTDEHFTKANGTASQPGAA
jgi:integrase